MDNTELMQDIRERLVRIEEKISNNNEKHLTLEKRVTKLEDNNTWLTRAIIGQVVAAIIGFFILKK